MARQPETVQEKLDMLLALGSVTEEFKHSICGCCGSFSLDEYKTRDAHRKNTYTSGNFIGFRTTKPHEDIILPETSEYLLIPDEVGNVSLEWEDV